MRSYLNQLFDDLWVFLNASEYLLHLHLTIFKMKKRIFFFISSFKNRFLFPLKTIWFDFRKFKMFQSHFFKNQIYLFNIFFCLLSFNLQIFNWTPQIFYTTPRIFQKLFSKLGVSQNKNSLWSFHVSSPFTADSNFKSMFWICSEINWSSILFKSVFILLYIKQIIWRFVLIFHNKSLFS